MKYRFAQRKKKKITGDKDEATIQSNESSKAVEETPEIKLVFDGTVRFVDILKLNYPARKIYTYPLVPFTRIKPRIN